MKNSPIAGLLRVVLILGAAFLFLSTPAASSAEPLSSYVIFSQTRVIIGQNSMINGLVGANFKADSSTQANAEVFLNGNAMIIGNVQSGDDITIGSGGQITGSVTLPMSPAGLNPLNPGGAGVLTLNGGTVGGAVINAMPSLPSLPAQEPAVNFTGGPSFSGNGNNFTLSLGPGQYGDVVLGGSNTLNLSSGTYHFNSLSSQNNLTINIDLTGGPVHIFSKTSIQFGSVQMHLIGGTAADVTWEADASGLNAFQAGGSSTVVGDILTPNGTIHIGSGSSENASFTGHLWGHDVDIEHGVDGMVPEPSTISLIALGGLAFAFRLRKTLRRRS